MVGNISTNFAISFVIWYLVLIDWMTKWYLFFNYYFLFYIWLHIIFIILCFFSFPDDGFPFDKYNSWHMHCIRTGLEPLVLKHTHKTGLLKWIEYREYMSDPYGSCRTLDNLIVQVDDRISISRRSEIPFLSNSCLIEWKRVMLGLRNSAVRSLF